MGSSEPRPERVQLDREHFSGRRRNVRRLCVMPVQLTGANGVFGGRTVDISRRGTLIEIRDPRFPSGERGLVEFARRVSEEFPAGFPVRFADLPLVVELRVARVTRHPAAASLLIGCEFVQPLNDRQCRVLGVPTAETPGDAGPPA
jgi:hypothetical protein